MQHDVGERFGRVVADERLAAFGDDGLVEVDRFLEVRMHGGLILSQGDGAKGNGIVYRTRVFPSCLADHEPDIVRRHARTHDGLSRSRFPRSCGVRRRCSVTSRFPAVVPDRSITRTTYAVVLDRATRWRAALRGARRRTRRPRGDAGMGKPAAPRGVSGDSLDRRRPAHAESAASPRRSVLHRQRRARTACCILDESLLPLFEQFRALSAAIEHVIVIASASRQPATRARVHRLRIAARGRRSGGARGRRDSHEDDAAAMCYTSGTTGRPKGVLYSHRAIVLHSFAQRLVDCLGIGERDTCCPIVPMFHVNAWGLPFTAHDVRRRAGASRAATSTRRACSICSSASG